MPCSSPCTARSTWALRSSPVPSCAAPCLGETLAACVAHLDLDPRVLRVEHAPGETVAGALVANDDVEDAAVWPGTTGAPSAGSVLVPSAATATATSMLAAPRSMARTASTWSLSPRIAASHVFAPAKRWEWIWPSFAAASPWVAASSGMWQVRHSAASMGSSTRAARLPAYGDRCHAPSSSWPTRCGGIARLRREERAVARAAHRAVRSGASAIRALWARRLSSSPSRGTGIGDAAST